MSHHPEVEQSGSSAAPPFALPPKPPSSIGPETVVNPERRGESPEPPDAPPMGGSTILHRLFPTGGGDSQAGWEIAAEPQGPEGVELGHFVIESLIGRGGMAAVFRAIDKRLQRVVALKVLSPQQSQNVSAVQRFLNEARATARLDHDNIARVHYVGQDRGLHFIAYEYVTGTNIRDLIHQTGRLDVAEAINYTLQVATALRHTSAAGVVHRDIKPSNIIVAPSGRAKLVDLGLARNEPSDSLGELTVAGTTLGTFDYISPEQARDPRNVDVRSDIYSLGCTMYEMLTGEPPYPEGTMAAKLFQHGGNEPPDASQKNRRVPKELAAIVKKMMASEPRRRHANPDEVIRDLMVVAGRMGIATLTPQGLVWTKPVGRRQAGFWERNLGWMATAAALIVIVVLLDRFHDRIADKLNRPAPTASRTDGGSGDTQAGANNGPSVVASDGNRRDGAHGSQRQADTAPSDAGNDGGAAIDPSPSQSGEEQPGNSTAEATQDRDGNDGTHGNDGNDSPTASAGNVVSSEKGAGGTGTPETASNPRRDSPRIAFVPVVAPVPDSFASGTTVASKGDRTRPATVSAPPRITIDGSGEAAGNSYDSLEAACASAEDGNVIVLRYNGRRAVAEKPLRIVNKKLTIRAAAGYRPVILFSPVAEFPGGAPTGMITLIDGSVDLINVDVEVRIGPQADTSQQWSLFALHGPQRIELRSVRATLRSADSFLPLSVVHLLSGTDEDLGSMKMPDDGAMPVPKEFEVKIVDSLLRGQCSLFHVAHTRPGRFILDQTALALEESLLSVVGDSEMPAENADLELTMDHVTSFLGGAVIRWETGELPRYVLPVSVTSRNSILSAKTDSPLIVMSGNTDADDFRRLLRWNGEKNFYDRFEAFWSISTELSTNPTGPLSFNAWKTQVQGTDPNNQPLAWQRAWWDRPSAETALQDFALDRSAERNPAIGGASTGSDAGVDPDRLPRPSTGIDE